jgi:hypothetical protein
MLMTGFSKYKKIWDEFLKERKLPRKITGFFQMPYNELINSCEKFNLDKAKKIVSNLIDGKILLVKGVLSDSLVNDIKFKVKKFWKENPDTFYKIHEGCPDFHRLITPLRAANYSCGAVKHATFFFRWNKDPYGFKKIIYERWRYIKYIAGLNYNEYENNTPKDGPVDRMQISCYPRKLGGLEKHFDPHHNCLLIGSCYLSSLKNSDFSTGGFYCVDNENKNILLEKEIDIGDLGLFIPTIEHGVSQIDGESEQKNYDWDSGIGRWWIGLFTTDSDLVKNRISIQSLERFHSEKVSNLFTESNKHKQ